MSITSACTGFQATGLSVTGTANDSGPYSNIIFDPDNRRVARRA
ncbi:MAG: hypothetical protein WBE44_07065 [Terriglobales bacterium]